MAGKSSIYSQMDIESVGSFSQKVDGCSKMRGGDIRMAKSRALTVRNGLLVPWITQVCGSTERGTTVSGNQRHLQGDDDFGGHLGDNHGPKPQSIWLRNRRDECKMQGQGPIIKD